MLALALGRTVAELQSTLSVPEYLAWREFYRLYPFDDRHRYYRPAAMVAGAFSGDQDAMRERLEWLQPDPMTAHLSDADRRTLAAFPGAKVRAAPTTKPKKG